MNSHGKKRVQGIVGALVYYVQAVDNKLLVGLSAIGSQQASAKQRTNEAIDQILDYCATITYPIMQCYLQERRIIQYISARRSGNLERSNGII